MFCFADSEGDGEEGGGKRRVLLSERVLGECPDTGARVLAKRGPYGPYVQLVGSCGHCRSATAGGGRGRVRRAVCEWPDWWWWEGW